MMLIKAKKLDAGATCLLFLTSGQERQFSGYEQDETLNNGQELVAVTNGNRVRGRIRIVGRKPIELIEDLFFYKGIFLVDIFLKELVGGPGQCLPNPEKETIRVIFILET